MAQSIPNRQTRKWRVSYKGTFFGDIVRNFLINLFWTNGVVRNGSKLFPHSVTSISAPADYVSATIYDGAARVNKVWAVAAGKEIFRSLANAAFEIDTSTGFTSTETTGLNSDILSATDTSEEDIVVTELSTPVGSDSFHITGSGNEQKYAQSFTHVGGPLSKFSFYVRKQGIPTDNLVVTLKANSAGAPTGAALLTLTIDAETLTDSYVLRENEIEDFTPTSYQLNNGTIYWWEFTRSGSADTDNYVAILIANGGSTEDEDNDPYENGELKAYNGSVWGTPTLTYNKTDTFTEDGTWTVPSGVTSVIVETFASGAAGTFDVGGGGGGAYSKSTISVTPAATHGIIVGQATTNREDGHGSAFNGIEILAVAGGGAGGAGNGTRPGGGGGAGGLLHKCFALAITTYAVTIGAGGSSSGDVGANTVFGSLITALGGGGGGTGAGNGDNGGSGGGATQATADPGTGTPGQGYNGGDGGDTDWGGGGGGASAVGANGAGTSGGVGGAGKAFTISGASVTYAGGGGGGGEPSGSGGAGGAGGGGAGSSTTHGTAGTANTGGGGGGGASDAPGNGGSGGSGVLIVRYLTGAYTATGGTITTSGGYTIHTFTANGTFEITAINASRVVAYGGLNGQNGGAGGATTDGVGDTKYAGGNGALGTGDQPGGGGAGDESAGSNATTGGDIGGGPGDRQGGSGGGEYNGTFASEGQLYGGGGRSSASQSFRGARGEVRITYNIASVADYPNVMSRSFGRSTTATVHSYENPPGTLPGDRLIMIASADGNNAITADNWTLIESTAQGSSLRQAILTKIAGGEERSGFIRTAVATGLTYEVYRIHNGGVPTATQEGGSGTMNPPSHTATESAKHLWITAGSYFSPDDITAMPSGYGSFLTMPTYFAYDDDNLFGPNTVVADRQVDALTEDPGSFTGSVGSYVAATISVPFDDTTYYFDMSASMEITFPEAAERLYVTTSEDVKFLAEEDTVWQSLWQGVFQQDPLDPLWPHPMKQVPAGQVAFLGDGNKIHSFILTGNNAIEALAARIEVPNFFYNSWITVTKSSVFFGFNNKESELLPSLIVYFEPSSELARLIHIKEGATVGWLSDENCQILDKSGAVRYWDGSKFKAYTYFPPYYDNQKITKLPHRNAISVRDEQTRFLWEGQYPHPAGQWILEDGNLYHEKGLVFSGTALNSYGALEGSGDFGALYDQDDVMFASAKLDNGAGGNVEGIFSDHKLAGVTVSDEVRGWLKTARFTSEEIDSKWGRVYSKVDNRLDGETEGGVVLKHRTKKSPIPEGYQADSFTGAWTTSTTFTCNTTEFKTAVDNGDIIVGDEIIVRKGMGAGFLTHILTIAGGVGAQKTITVREGMAAITTGAFTFSVENWKLMGNKMVVKDTSAEWLELKVEVQDQVGLEELQITSKNNKTLK